MQKRYRWIDLNKELEALGADMLEDLKEYQQYVGPLDLRIITALFRKSNQVLAATNLISDAGLWDEVQILARILFELRIKFDFFIKEALENENEAEACDLLLDAWLLQRVKELEASSWLGVSDDTKNLLTAQIAMLRTRRSEKDIKKLRYHGFPGQSLKQCAEALGHLEPYEVFYRRFSKGIHSSDYVEFMVGPNSQHDAQYRDVRDPITAYVVHFSAGGIAEKVNLLLLQRKYDEPLHDLGIRRKKLTG